MGCSVGLLQAEERSSLSASGELQSLATGRLLKKDRWSDAFLPRKTAIVYVRFVCPPVRKLGIRIRKFQLVYLVHSILGKSYVSMPIIMSIVQAGSNLCFYGNTFDLNSISLAVSGIIHILDYLLTAKGNSPCVRAKKNVKRHFRWEEIICGANFILARIASCSLPSLHSLRPRTSESVAKKMASDDFAFARY